MPTYTVTVVETWAAYNHMQVEADNEFDAREIAMEKAESEEVNNVDFDTAVRAGLDFMDIEVLDVFES